MNGSDGYLSIAEEQQAELEVMKELHAFCVKHGLRYILAYGTLLGAIRHKGFIPWDTLPLYDRCQLPLPHRPRLQYENHRPAHLSKGNDR